eukprot:3160265-Lingulodinium_polyedra.AAC.1
MVKSAWSLTVAVKRLCSTTSALSLQAPFWRPPPPGLEDRRTSGPAMPGGQWWCRRACPGTCHHQSPWQAPPLSAGPCTGGR